MNAHIAEKTIDRYGGVARMYTDWVISMGWLVDGLVTCPTEDDLIAYATYLVSSGYGRGLSPSTARQHLSGINSYFEDHGFQPPLYYEHSSRYRRKLVRLLRGMKRTVGKPRKFAKALTTDKLKVAASHFCMLEAAGYIVGWDDVMMKAASTSAVYGLLRVGEFTSTHVKEQLTERGLENEPKKRVHLFDEDLCRGDVKLYYCPRTGKLDFMTLRIKKSKTDKFRAGTTRRIYCTGTDDCPVQAMAAYLALNEQHGITVPHRSSPLFVRSNGSWLTRGWFSDRLKDSLRAGGEEDFAKFSSHSCRAGGACSMLAAGYGEEVGLIGRWSSDCFKDYLAMPNALLAEVCTNMALVRPDDVSTSVRARLEDALNAIKGS